MKKLYLLLLLSNIAFAQATHIEVRLIDATVGTPQCDYFIDDWLCNTTNDSGLNAILTNYNVQYFRVIEGHPYIPYQGRIFNINYSSNDALLVADLMAYSSVIDNAVVTSSPGFSDALFVDLVNANIGVPNGTSGNIIVTNDSGLNALFQTYNVFQFSSYLSSLTGYTLVCNCDVEALKNELDNYTSVIAGTYNAQGVILANDQHEFAVAVIAPNPFSTNFTIETNRTVLRYTINDISGKTIVSTSIKSDMDNAASQLTEGMYILNLDFENGQKANYKLIKK